MEHPTLTIVWLWVFVMTKQHHCDPVTHIHVVWNWKCNSKFEQFSIAFVTFFPIALGKTCIIVSFGKKNKNIYISTIFILAGHFILGLIWHNTTDTVTSPRNYYFDIFYSNCAIYVLKQKNPYHSSLLLIEPYSCDDCCLSWLIVIIQGT